jgi:predicted ATP-grasp superfamily ATP-dependent carboligase
MAEPARFVHVVDDVPELGAASAAAEGSRPVMLVALHGFLDAGNAGRLAVEHLLERAPGRVVASFDVDALYDYRARRPALTFMEDHYEDYDAPRLVVRVCQDGLAAPYLLLHGPEPDTYWEAFAAAVRSVVERFRVRLTVSLGSVPMAVPHTRPVMLTNHATSAGLLVRENVWKGRIRVPSSAQSLLELRLGGWGHDAMGFVAHVPHYLAQVDYPAASLSLLEAAEEVTGLQWRLEELQRVADARAADIAAQIADSEEVREVVAGLEQQYDAFARAAGDDSSLPLAQERDLPTAEELGEEFERFLAGLDQGDE